MLALCGLSGPGAPGQWEGLDPDARVERSCSAANPTGTNDGKEAIDPGSQIKNVGAFII